LFSDSAYGRLRGRIVRLLAHPRAPLALLLAVALVGTGARVFHLDIPAHEKAGEGYVFDEKYYVNAARVIAGVPMNPRETYANQAPAGSDPNGEHPQLGKVIIATSIRLFGDSATSWRASAVVFGVGAILLLYWLVLCAGGSPWLALGAASIASVENLWLVSSRIAVLDIYTIPFMLAGAAFYLRRQPIVAGVLIGAGATVKEFAAYAVFALIALEGLRALRYLWERRQGGSRLRAIARPVVLTVVAVMTYFSLLAVLDVSITPYHDGRPLNRGQASVCAHIPIWGGACSHFTAMNSYAARLRTSGAPVGIASYPWQFWINQKDIHYFQLNRTVSNSKGQVVAIETVIDYQGLINPVVLVSSWLAILLSLWWALRRRDDLSLLVIAWIAGTWLPAEAFSLVGQRITYLYYMVTTMPALYIAVARMLRLREVPRWAVGIWVGFLLAGVALLYPLRTFTGT
jgi:4-amino-4-deoxy-L-arabinose transferase-like glycosyltransferase